MKEKNKPSSRDHWRILFYIPKQDFFHQNKAGLSSKSFGQFLRHTFHDNNPEEPFNQSTIAMKNNGQCGIKIDRYSRL